MRHALIRGKDPSFDAQCTGSAAGGDRADLLEIKGDMRDTVDIAGSRHDDDLVDQPAILKRLECIFDRRVTVEGDQLLGHLEAHTGTVACRNDDRGCESVRHIIPAPKPV